jgi:hypothetical protein
MSEEANYIEDLISQGPSSIKNFRQDLPYKNKVISAILVNLICLHVVEMIYTEKGVYYQLNNPGE